MDNLVNHLLQKKFPRINTAALKPLNCTSILNTFNASARNTNKYKTAQSKPAKNCRA